jgi:uncharacterized membrane protein HdeD (DUF308 family)
MWAKPLTKGDVMEVYQINWKFLMIEGIILALLGLVALFFPLAMAVSFELLLGSLLIVAGLVQGISLLTHLKEKGSVFLLIGAAVALIAGILLLIHPLRGVLTLTLLLMVFFFIDGISKILSSWEFRHLKGWGWLLFSGIVSLALAIMILTGLPTTAIWVLGVYLGVYLLFIGIALITLSCNLKKETFVIKK